MSTLGEVPSGSAAQQAALISAQPPAADEPQMSRAGRVLLGFLPEEQAPLAMTGRRHGQPLTVEQVQALSATRRAVRERPEGLDQTDVIRPAPPELDDYILRLRSSGVADAHFNEGWQVALADLPRLGAFQPHVLVDSATDRVAGIDVDDLVDIATVTLPLVPAQPVAPTLDESKKTFVVSSANPNLRVTGMFAAQVDPNRPEAVGMGFSVQVLPSFVQVASLNGRYFVRDGYHRTIGLVQRGVRYAPVFVHDEIPHGQLVPPGMLPFEVYTGTRPAVVADYWDESVSRSLPVPVTHKVIMIQATEIDVIG